MHPREEIILLLEAFYLFGRHFHGFTIKLKLHIKLYNLSIIQKITNKLKEGVTGS